MHKKRIFAAVLAAVALCSVLIHASATEGVIQKDGLVYVPDHSVFFADVDGQYAWAVQPVDFLANLKIISGTANCVYTPEKALSRADFVTMLTRAYDMTDYVGGGSFADVPEGAYYSDAVSAAKNLGIVSGDPNGKFNPTSALTRQDAMVMLRRTLSKTGLTFPDGDLSAFSDASAVADYAQNDVAALAQAGIISGSGGKVNPKNSVTRAEMAVMLYRAMMLEPDENGNPVYTAHSNVVNLCIGESFYANVTVENAADGQTFSGLYHCDTMRGEGEDFTVSLGESAAMNQTIVWKDNILTVDGEAVTVAEDCDAVSISPYGLISGGLTSTGGEYKAAAVSRVNGAVTAVYYTR
ncbi:MAG: S-layer homology domain-containing protein [Butyricicoccus sp.]